MRSKRVARSVSCKTMVQRTIALDVTAVIMRAHAPLTPPCGRWEGVELPEVELLSMRSRFGGGDHNHHGHRSPPEIDVRTKPLSTVHCSALCLDRVPVEFSVESPVGSQ